MNSLSSIVSILSLLLCSLRAFATEPPVTSVAFAPDGKSVVACSQAGLTIYSWPELQSQRKFETSISNLHDIAFSPSGNRLAVAGGSPSEYGTVEILSWPRGTTLHARNDHEDSVIAVAWRDAMSIASASLDHRVIIGSAEGSSIIRSLEGHSRGVSALCLLPVDEMLVSAGIDHSLRVWKLDSGELLRSLNMHTLPIHAIALRPSKKGLPMVASASDDKTIRLWQPTIGRMVRFAKLKSKPLDIDWLPDGSQIVASCTDGHVYWMDADSVEVTRDVPVLDGWAYALAVHPTDGTMLVGGSNGQLRRLDVGDDRRPASK